MGLLEVARAYASSTSVEVGYAVWWHKMYHMEASVEPEPQTVGVLVEWHRCLFTFIVGREWFERRITRL
jgi:hypothetical protein